jgi:putative addiction module killer protein
MPRGFLDCATGLQGLVSTSGSDGSPLGNSGDIRPVGDGVSELRIHYGPGYRVYLTKQGDAVVILLAGGDKSSQDMDIRLAKDLARNL